MPAVRYFDRHSSPGARTISNAAGSQPGPPGGDGWALVESIPAETLPAGHIAVYVTGILSDVQVIGSPPAAPKGLIQLCLGSSDGTKSDTHLWNLSVNDASTTTAISGRRFTWLLLIDASTGDPTWGSAWPGTADLRIYGRLWWVTDPPTYTCSFDVSDIEVTIALLGNIPPGEQHSYADGTVAALPDVRSDSGAFGALDERWLVMGSLYLRPGGSSSGGVTISHHDLVAAPGGAIIPPATGTDTWGPLPNGSPNTENARDTLGHLHVRTTTGATTLSIFSGHFQLAGGLSSALRWAFVAIRLDALSPVLLLEQDLEVAFTEYGGNVALGERQLVLEVGTQQLSFEPIVIAAMQVAQAANPGTRPHGLYLADNTGEVYAQPVRYQVGEPQVEQMQFLFSSNGIGFGDPSFRYQLACIKPLVPIGIHQGVQAISLVAFHPFRDPDGQAPAVPSVGAPVPIVPGAEGPSGAATFTIQPNATFEESPQVTIQRHEGHSSYTRTWGIWLKPRRTFRLEWAPVSAADRATIEAEVRAGSVRFWTPPDGAPIAVAAFERPTVTDLGAGTWRVGVAVAELVYTL